jgi:hypothetical protein
LVLGRRVVLPRGVCAAGRRAAAGGRPSSATTYACILAGYGVQLFALGVRGKLVAGCPLGNQFEVYQFVAWSAITLYLVVGVTFRNGLLGFFTSSLAAGDPDAHLAAARAGLGCDPTLAHFRQQPMD